MHIQVGKVPSLILRYSPKTPCIPMKKIQVLLILLLVAILSSCQTIPAGSMVQQSVPFSTDSGGTQMPTQWNKVGYEGTHVVTMSDGDTTTMNDSQLAAFMATNGQPTSWDKKVDNDAPIYIGPNGERLGVVGGSQQTVTPIQLPAGVR